MNTVSHPWDYLIVTASHPEQARAYCRQLEARRRLGHINDVRHLLVIPDPEGRRIGSGGSTILCWIEVLKRELEPASSKRRIENESWEQILSGLRILIIHAGGDSRRLPAYSPCGKLFVPIPGEGDSPVGETLFDRQLPIYLELPPPAGGGGQTIITTGDVLLFFDPGEARFQTEGLTGLGTWVDPEVAKNHGVFCIGDSGHVRAFIQKPSRREQEEKRAVNHRGQTLLDIGVMSLSPGFAARLLTLCGVGEGGRDELGWKGAVADAILKGGIDFFLEIGCAMGDETDISAYLKAVKNRSKLPESVLSAVYRAVSDVPFISHQLRDCRFLHFGTSRQLIRSGTELMRCNREAVPDDACLLMDNRMEPAAEVSGGPAWVEGCLLEAPLKLGGDNIVVGADILDPLELPRGACLDVIKGDDGSGNPVWFVRFYGIDDDFKFRWSEDSATFCQLPVGKWLAAAGAHPDQIWETENTDGEGSLWDARLFPAAAAPSDFKSWLWMLDPRLASEDRKKKWLEGKRFSLREIAKRALQDDFIERRWTHRADEVRRSLRRIFRRESAFSAHDLGFVLERFGEDRLKDGIRDSVREAVRHLKGGAAGGLDRLHFSRIIHSLGSALREVTLRFPHMRDTMWPELVAELPEAEAQSLSTFRLDPSRAEDLEDWCQNARDAAFVNLSRTIVMSTPSSREPPRSAVRADEIIWGRAPARLDLGGGWTDTPPYSLENGGCVINAAVDLNGQPPIQVYARIIPEPEIRIASIDHGTRIAIHDLEELLDYREATSTFGLAKAALALSGLDPDRASWPRHTRSLGDILRLFGGGIELTTLAAIPSGSGLGTSSIMGAALILVISRLMGRSLTQRELFNAVLQLEQELTTGGGWQDQIGGSVPGVKMISTQPGLVPDPRIQEVSAEVLDPARNGGQTLLYYTGMRRLAKNILRNVVGNYLDRSRSTLDTLRKLHAYPPLAVDAMTRRDFKRFGELIELAWKLNKRLDPDSSTPAVEVILERFRPHMHGAKLLGAGGGGFLLVVCKSKADAKAAREALERDPPNPLARFFQFSISLRGLEVTAS
jgi:galactokinase/mevalonate kinase-like predicted kinase